MENMRHMYFYFMKNDVLPILKGLLQILCVSFIYTLI
jgi:hypothetical protein